MNLTSDLLTYKKYVLWIAGICPIAEMVRNTTFDDDLDSFWTRVLTGENVRLAKNLERVLPVFDRLDSFWTAELPSCQRVLYTAVLSKSPTAVLDR